jgi:hypothetical protein
MPSQRRTVFLIGAGAIRNAWPPVARALRECFPKYPSGDENGTFAKQVFYLRWLTSQRRAGDADFRSRVRVALRAELERLRLLKSGIALKLGEAELRGVLSVQPEFASVLAHFQRGTWSIITTNWDRTIETTYPTLPPPIHLHGDIGDPSTLYLPSEVTEEAYAPSRSARKYLRKRLGWSVDLVARADRIVVYGLSLSPLDAELGAILSSGRDGEPSLRDAIVVNTASEVDLVARRLRFHISVRRIRRVTPEALRRA